MRVFVRAVNEKECCRLRVEMKVDRKEMDSRGWRGFRRVLSGVKGRKRRISNRWKRNRLVLLEDLMMMMMVVRKMRRGGGLELVTCLGIYERLGRIRVGIGRMTWGDGFGACNVEGQDTRRSEVKGRKEREVSEFLRRNCEVANKQRNVQVLMINHFLARASTCHQQKVEHYLSALSCALMRRCLRVERF